MKYNYEQVLRGKRRSSGTFWNRSVITCVEMGKSDDSLIMRFYNQSPEERQATVRPHLAKTFARKSRRAELSERVLEHVSQRGTEDIELEAKPWDIVTLKLSKGD